MMAHKPQSVADYFRALPPKQRSALKKLRATIKSIVPDATEKISWGMPIFSYRGRQLVGYAGFKEHCSLFVMSPRVRSMFADELKSFSTSKGTIRFTVEKPLPMTLVKKMVKARMVEISHLPHTNR